MSEFDLYINPSASPGILCDHVLRFSGGRSSMELQHATIRVVPSDSSKVNGAALHSLEYSARGFNHLLMDLNRDV